MKTKFPVFLALFLSARCLADARVSSPGNVTFSAPNAVNTNATFDSSGTFVLQLSAFDGAKTSTRTVSVTVLPAFVPVVPNITIGNASGVIAGNAWDVITTFSTGTLGVSSLQYDIGLSPVLSSPTVTTGAAALAAGKNATCTLVPGGARILIFGLNQTLIGAGQVATVNIKTSPTIAGTFPLPISGIVASDAAGGPVVVTGTNGSLAVTANQAPVVNLIPTAQTITLPAVAIITGTSSDDLSPCPPCAVVYSWSVL